MARLVSGRLPTRFERRLRLRLPLRLSGVHLDDLDAEDRLDGVVDLGLGGVGVDEERVDVLLDQRVALLAHDRLDDDVAGVLHLPSSSSASPSPSTVGRLVASASASSAAVRARAGSVRPIGRRRLSGRRRAAWPCGEHDPVVAQHVVGVELADARAAAPRAGCGSSRTTLSSSRPHDDQRPCPRAPSAASAALRVLGARGVEAPARRRRRTLPSAARSDSAERSARRIIFLGVRWP